MTNIIAFIERFGFYILFIIILILNEFFKIDLSQMSDYKYLFSSLIAIIAIALGFLTTILSQLKSYNNFEIIKYFKKEGYYKILIIYYIESIMSSIISVILSLFLGIYFCSYEVLLYTKGLSSVYMAINISCLYSYIKITYFYIKINNLAEAEFTLKQQGYNKKESSTNFHFDKKS